MDIPLDVCEALGLFAGQKFELSTPDQKILLTPVANRTHTKSIDQKERRPNEHTRL